MTTSYVICGPTAGGKSDLAVALAHHLAGQGRPAEIVSADAYQVYRGLDIASAKPTVAEMAGVPHHLIDIVDPTEAFTVHDWLGVADRACAEITARDAVPIVVGGTHLYIKAFLDGLFEGPEPDEAVRAKFTKMDPADRRRLLESVDPAAAERIHPNDARRTIRALEVHEQTGTPISELQAQWDADAGRPGAQLIVIDWETEAINRRINARVGRMVEAGLVEETRALLEDGRLGPQAREALGTKQIAAHLERAGGPGPADTLAEVVERIKIETRRFAKNQRTWLRRLRARPGTIRFVGGSDPRALFEKLDSEPT